MMLELGLGILYLYIFQKKEKEIEEKMNELEEKMNELEESRDYRKYLRDNSFRRFLSSEECRQLKNSYIFDVINDYIKHVYNINTPTIILENEISEINYSNIVLLLQCLGKCKMNIKYTNGSLKTYDIDEVAVINLENIHEISLIKSNDVFKATTILKTYEASINYTDAYEIWLEKGDGIEFSNRKE